MIKYTIICALVLAVTTAELYSGNIVVTPKGRYGILQNVIKAKNSKNGVEEFWVRTHTDYHADKFQHRYRSSNLKKVTLPGGFQVGDVVYAASDVHGTGKAYVKEGTQGEVTGAPRPDKADPACRYPRQLRVVFSGNNAWNMNPTSIQISPFFEVGCKTLMAKRLAANDRSDFETQQVLQKRIDTLQSYYGKRDAAMTKLAEVKGKMRAVTNDATLEELEQKLARAKQASLSNPDKIQECITLKAEIKRQKNNTNGKEGWIHEAKTVRKQIDALQKTINQEHKRS